MRQSVLAQVLFGGDDPLLHSFYRNLIESAPGLELVASMERVEEILTALLTLGVALLVLDFKFSAGFNLDVVRRIRELDPEIPLVVVPQQDTLAWHMELVRYGVLGIVPRSRVPEDLTRAIRAVARGGTWISPLVTRELIRQYSVTQQLLARHQELQAPVLAEARGKLGPRELEVLELVGEALTNEEIGKRLGMARTTVNQHVSSILHKLEIHNRTGLAIRVAGGPGREELLRSQEEVSALREALRRLEHEEKKGER